MSAQTHAHSAWRPQGRGLDWYYAFVARRDRCFRSSTVLPAAGTPTTFNDVMASRRTATPPCHSYNGERV